MRKLAQLFIVMMGISGLGFSGGAVQHSEKENVEINAMMDCEGSYVSCVSGATAAYNAGGIGFGIWQVMVYVACPAAYESCSSN